MTHWWRCFEPGYEKSEVLDLSDLDITFMSDGRGGITQLDEINCLREIAVTLYGAEPIATFLLNYPQYAQLRSVLAHFSIAPPNLFPRNLEGTTAITYRNHLTAAVQTVKLQPQSCVIISIGS
jgi:hypothetical protein